MSTSVPKSGSEVRMLRQFATFERFSTGDLRRLVRAADRISLSANWPFIQEKTPEDTCYIVLSGAVTVFAGRDPIAHLGPGAVVGEVALRKQQLRSATVTTREPVEMLRIDSETLHRLLRELPALQEVIDRLIIEHGGQANQA